MDDNAYIKIGVKPFALGYNEFFEFVIPLDSSLLMEIMEPIHEDDLGLYIGGLEIAKAEMERKLKITKTRKYWSKMLSEKITEYILDYLERKDTVNGYMKSER